MITQLMRAFGLVPQAELLLAEERLEVARQEVTRTTERYEHDLARSREAAADAARRIAALERKLHDRELQIEEAFHAESQLETQITAATETLELTRRDLSAIEVKLNILEAAANVLDARFRGAGRPRP